MLHLGLDHIDGVVCHNGDETGEATSEQINNDLIAHEVAEVLFGVGEDDKADGLVGALFHHGGDHTSVETLHTGLLCDGVDALEDVRVLRGGRKFVMDQFGFECFLRSHNKQSFRKAGKQTAHEGVALTVLSEHILLREFERTKSD